MKSVLYEKRTHLALNINRYEKKRKITKVILRDRVFFIISISIIRF